MLTLTAIVLALGLGWAVIKVWSAMASEPAAKPAAPETPEQVAVR